MKRFKKILPFTIIIMTILVYSGCMVMQERTFVGGWWVIGISVIITIMLIILLIYKNQLPAIFGPKWLNIIFFTAILPSLLIISFYLSNYLLSDKDSNISERAVVEKRYYKIRHKRKRLTRTHYVQGDPYKVYFIDVKFSNGVRKSFEIPLRSYSKLHKCDSLEYRVESGLFGIPVIKDTSANFNQD